MPQASATTGQPLQAIQAVQVSLGFERAHPKVWDYFRGGQSLVVSGRASDSNWKFFADGKPVIAYSPKSQGGCGVIGVGTIVGAGVQIEASGTFLDDKVGQEYLAHMQGVYSNPANQLKKRARCFNRTFKYHRDRLAQAEGGEHKLTPWAYSQRFLDLKVFKKKRHPQGAMYRFEVNWEAAVPFEQGIMDFDWAGAGLKTFHVPQLASIASRHLSQAHLDLIKSTLKTASDTNPPKVIALRRLKRKAPAELLSSIRSKLKAGKKVANSTDTLTRPTTIADLMGSLCLAKYTSRLQEEEIDLAALRLLNDDDLKELGFPMGPRRKLQNKLQEMCTLV